MSTGRCTPLGPERLVHGPGGGLAPALQVDHLLEGTAFGWAPAAGGPPEREHGGHLVFAAVGEAEERFGFGPAGLEHGRHRGADAFGARREADAPDGGEHRRLLAG